jgi:tripartite-type tricarboxylate transporter receptor subunit TctC
VIESDFPDFVSTAWWGCFTARATPRAIIDRFSNALADTLREPAIKSRIAELQITLQLGGPDVQRQLVADQMKLWGHVVKEHSIQADN